MPWKVIVVILVLLGSLVEVDAATIIHAGRLINGHDGKLHQEMSLVINDGKIISVDKGFVKPTGDDTLIDLRKFTVTPGWMDMHTHLMSQHHKKVYSDRFFMNHADYALRSTVYAKRTLMAGFTTVRDLGDNGVNSVSLRKAINEGWIVGPRIFTSGKSLATTGGHADPTNGLKGDYRFDRARNIHDRRSHDSDERTRHVSRPDDFGRSVGR